MSSPEIRISGNAVTVFEGKTKIGDYTMQELLASLGRSAAWQPRCTTLPAGTKRWIERGDSVAICIEIPPHARTVHWIAKGSKRSYGRHAAYEHRHLAFPYVNILVVLHGGELTNTQQLYYRRESLDVGEDLLYPNLLNVSPNSYGVSAWLCLANLEPIGALSWPKKIEAIVDHVFSAAFNQSSEAHEGSSFWKEGDGIDERVDSVETWEATSRANPLFAVNVAWRPANTTVSQELEHMLGVVAPDLRTHSAADLSGLLFRERALGRRPA